MIPESEILDVPPSVDVPPAGDEQPSVDVPASPDVPASDTSARRSIIPQFDDTPASPTAAPLSSEAQTRIDGIATHIMGTTEAAGPLAKDLKTQAQILQEQDRAARQSRLREAVTGALDEFLDRMEEIATDVDTIELGEKLYGLTTLFSTTDDQREELWGIIEQVKQAFYRIESTGGEIDAETGEPVKDADGNWKGATHHITFDIEAGLRAIIAGGHSRPLFSRLYLPIVNGKRIKYRKHTPDEHLEAMRDLEFSQQLGALYRFFTSSALISRAAIQRFLEALTIR
jgi:hypothetical protein